MRQSPTVFAGGVSVRPESLVELAKYGLCRRADQQVFNGTGFQRSCIHGAGAIECFAGPIDFGSAVPETWTNPRHENSTNDHLLQKERSIWGRHLPVRPEEFQGRPAGKVVNGRNVLRDAVSSGSFFEAANDG